MEEVLLVLSLAVISGFLLYYCKTENQGRRCEAISSDVSRIYNVCVLSKNHIGAHLTIDGMIF
jgi:hypothetical protein